MNTFFMCFATAFVISCVAMPICVRLARLVGAVSEIGGRHVGELPIARLGGLGVLVSLLSTVLILYWMDSAIQTVFDDMRGHSGGVMIGIVLVAIVGFGDDIRRLPALLKLGVQVGAALSTYFCGLGIFSIDMPFLEPIQLGWFSLPITILWIVGIVNAVNLIDGLDGLAGGVLFFSSLVNFVAAISIGSSLPAIIMIAMSGSILGFLVFNWFPAKIYLGDGGAYSLGFLLSISGLLAPVQKVSTGISLAVPALALGLPIFDTVLTMLRRSLNRRGIFTPDRGHIHHILLDAGISHRLVVVGLYAVCLCFCSIAVVVVLHRNRFVGYFLLTSSILAIFCWGYLVKGKLKAAVSNFINSETKLVDKRFINH